MVLILRNSDKPKRRCKTWHVDLNMSLARSLYTLRHSLPPSTVSNSQLDFWCSAVSSESYRKMASMPPSPTATLLRPPSYHPMVDWMPADAHPQYYVINPMHVVSLKDRSRTFGVRCVEKIKAISEKWFTHVLLLLFLFGYASLGAILFKMLEAPRETRGRSSVIDLRNLIVQKLWESHVRTETEKDVWTKEVQFMLKVYEQQVYQMNVENMSKDSESNQWTFWGGMFYCCTVFTTIGYGNIAPRTKGGQAVTIVYAFIGIPFLLMVLADLGKLFTRGIKYVFRYLSMFYHTGRCRRMRRAGRRATAVPAQFMSVAWNSMPYPSRFKTKRAAKNNNNNKEKDAESAKEKELDDAEVLSYVEPVQPNTYDVDDEFNLPVSVAVLILIGYMTLGAWVFTIWEDWEFFESFYFVFISMSTIGFGDYVPNHPMYMMATFIYLLFGLALTSMCINVVQEKLSATFEMARLRLGTTFGLDVSNMMQFDDYNKQDIAEVHGKNKSRSGSKSDGETSPKTDVKSSSNREKNLSNGQTRFQE